MNLNELLEKVKSGELEQQIDKAIETLENQKAMVSLLRSNVKMGTNIFGGILNGTKATRKLDETLNDLRKTAELLKNLKDTMINLKNIA